MRSQDAVSFSALAATTAAFNLQGGYYALVQNGDTFTSSNHFDVQVLLTGTTYVTALAGVQTGTAGFTLGYLPPGLYKLTLTGTLTAVNITLTRVPLD